MVSAGQFLVVAAGTTTLAVLVHLVPWSYPSPLTTTGDSIRARELVEVACVFALVVTGLGYAALVFRGVVSDVELLSVGEWRLDLVLAVSAVVHVFVPLGLELGVRSRSPSELGFRWPTNWFPAAFLIAFGIGVGVSAIGSGRIGPRPPLELVAALWTPVFEEELFYRGVVQSKLEHAIGQQWAWIGSGVLFGVAHVPIDFFGQFWVASGGDVAVAAARLASQIGFGLLFGVVYRGAGRVPRGRTERNAFRDDERRSLSNHLTPRYFTPRRDHCSRPCSLTTAGTNSERSSRRWVFRDEGY